MNKYIRIAVLVSLCLIVGYMNSIFTQISINDWYPTLKKPFFNPPNWVFAPVWTTLYVLMGISGGIVWNEISKQPEIVKKGLLFFIFQLVLNLIWSYLFFGLKNILLASIEVVLLWLFIYETIVVFKKINRKASLLLIPYLAWVGFASILTISIYILN